MDQFSKFCLRQQLFTFKEFRMKTRLHNISKNTNGTNFTKTILESSYKVLLGTCNLTAPKRFFFKSPRVLSNFWHLICYNFSNISRKIAKLYFLEASQWSLTTRQNHVYRATHYGEPPIRFWRLLFPKQK